MKLRSYFFAFALCLNSFTAMAHGDAPQEDNFGQPGDPLKINRTVKVEMRDSMRFSPDKVHVKKR